MFVTKPTSLIFLYSLIHLLICLIALLPSFSLQKICSAPTLFPDDINLAHSKQGLLGDCWFLCACSFLLQNKHLLNKVEWHTTHITASSQNCWQGSWLFLGAAPRSASVGWLQIQRLLQVLFLAAWTLDGGDCWWPASLHQLRTLLLTMPLHLCLLGGAVGKSLCKVNSLFNLLVYSHGFKLLFKIDRSNFACIPLWKIPCPIS